MGLSDPGTIELQVEWWLELHELLPCIALLERNGNVVAANELARQELSLTLPVECVALLGDAYRVSRATAERERQRFTCTPKGRHGQRLTMSAASQSVLRDGEVFGLIVLMEPATEAAHAWSDRRLVDDLLDAAPEPTAIISEGRVVHVNREFLRFFGYTLEQCVGEELAGLVIPESRLHEIEMVNYLLAKNESVSLESMVHTRTGDLIDVAVDMTQMRLGGCSGAHLMIRYRDIRQQKREEARLQHRALHDGLTGLPNRMLFLDRLRLTLSRLRRRPDRNFAIMFLDLDGFKHVNDTLGHAAGDALLVTVKERLMQCLRPQDTVARFGGDEFALLLDEQGSVGDAENVALRLQEEICRPVDLNGAVAHISLSIGVAMGTIEYTTAEQMMQDADSAMYAAKTQGKARHVVFEGGRTS